MLTNISSYLRRTAMDPAPDAPSEPVDRQRLLDLVVFEYRSLVVRRLGVTAEWRVLEWTDAAACADQPAATQELCGRCPVVAECLAAAVASDDRAEWRGGISREDREHLWEGLERTYREVRDFELMRLDVNLLMKRTSPTSAQPDQGQRSTAMTGDRGRQTFGRRQSGCSPRPRVEPTRTAHRVTSPSSSPVCSPRQQPTLAKPSGSSPADLGPGKRVWCDRWSPEP